MSFIQDPGAIAAIRSDFLSGASDPVALVETILERAPAVEAHVHAWLSLDGDAALRQARASRDEMRRGVDRGPLHGIPVAIKDVIDITGQSTRANSASRQDCRPATMDASIVAMLRAAGAIILGKAHTTEYAYFEGVPPTRNPWHLSHTPGGSSAGSAAAVASGTAVAAIGTQTAGSVVRPAAYCGIAAFKPTSQSLSTAGVVALAPSFDTVGWFGYRMADAAAMSAGLQPQRFGNARSARPLRVAILRDALFSDASLPVCRSIEICHERLRSAGHSVEVLNSPVELLPSLALHGTVLEYELAHIHGELETTHPDKVSKAWLAAIIRGKGIADSAYLDALHAIHRMQSTFWGALGALDALIVPAAPHAAPEGMRTGDPRYIIPFTTLGGPIATVPVGLAPSGLPLGVMLCGKPGGDTDLLSHALLLAEAIEMPRNCAVAPGRAE